MPLPLLAANDLPDLAGRIAIAPGCRIVYDPEYEEGAAVPLDPFALPDQTCAAEFGPWRSPAPHSVNFIGLFPLPNVLDCSFRSALLQVSTYKEVMAILDTPEFHSFCNNVTRTLTTVLNVDGPIELKGISMKAPGMSTVTVDNSSGLRVGLHLDSNDRKSVYERDQCRNRLSINLGLGSRYLLFQNLTVGEIIDLLGKKGMRDIHPQICSGIARLFRATAPEVPVLRLRIDPGEAYVAPTENIIHDASTIGSTQNDFSLSLLGNFTIKDRAN
ncbi:hypothetical protein F183_A11930 [Bryobacterales bacterium F-183]|nr:hypothetical protein F183_A11930 [Bryobacterales bacterium F-183]